MSTLGCELAWWVKVLPNNLSSVPFWVEEESSNLPLWVYVHALKHSSLASSVQCEVLLLFVVRVLPTQGQEEAW